MAQNLVVRIGEVLFGLNARPVASNCQKVGLTTLQVKKVLGHLRRAVDQVSDDAQILSVTLGKPKLEENALQAQVRFRFVLGDGRRQTFEHPYTFSLR